MGEKITRELFDAVPEIDFNSGYRFFLGNMDNYIYALLSALKSLKSKHPILKAMHRTREYEGLKTIVQMLQRMMNHIGASGVAQLSYEVEAALLNQDEAIQEMLDDYIGILYQFTEHLEQLLLKLDMKSFLQKQDEPSSFFHYDFTKTKESIKLSAGLLERKII